VNLLGLLRGDLRELNLGGLQLKQAYPAVPAQSATLIGSLLSDSAIAEAMSVVVFTALSHDGSYAVAGTFEGDSGSCVGDAFRSSTQTRAGLIPPRMRRAARATGVSAGVGFSG
jgi:hypothetical protein